MAEQFRQSRSLSEISHLFLSNVRQKHAGAGVRPQRQPPPPLEPPDLTPEELRHVFSIEGMEESAPRVPPVEAVIAAHMVNPPEAIRAYAGELAQGGRRIGLITIDACEMHVVTFAPAGEGEVAEAVETTCGDIRAMRGAINELNWDLDGWLIAPVNPRLAEVRGLLRGIGQWTVLSGAGPEGVVAAYRAIKALSEVARPKLSLAVVNAPRPTDAALAYQKLASTCRQFLDWVLDESPAVVCATGGLSARAGSAESTGSKLPVAQGPESTGSKLPVAQGPESTGSKLPVAQEYGSASLKHRATGVCENRILCCKTANDKSQLAVAAHWQVVEELTAKAASAEAKPESAPTQPETAVAMAEEPGPIEPSGPRLAADAYEADEVIELAGTGEGALAVAVVKHLAGELVECPLRPPMCPQAALAVSRDRRLTLIAAAGEGLEHLCSIARAWRWMGENRSLLAMALPQVSMDASQAPHLRLLVDEGDLEAELLQPLMQLEAVTVSSYRKVRWGQRTGLLLQAA